MRTRINVALFLSKCNCVALSYNCGSVSAHEVAQQRALQSTSSKFVMPSSFKKSADLAPTLYRTPSPPRKSFEPISPVLNGNAAEGLQRADTLGHCNGGLKRPWIPYDDSDLDVREQNYLLGGPMDAFASIALATKSNGRHRPSTSTEVQLINEGWHDIDRPSKRAKSEKLPLLDWSRTTVDVNPRPATSYEQSPESRRHEAELLLNFAHQAAKLACPPHGSPQLHTPLPCNISQKSLRIRRGPGQGSPESRARVSIEDQASNIKNDVNQVDLRTPSYVGRLTDEKRPTFEADPGQEKGGDHEISCDLDSESSHTTYDQSAAAKKPLSPTAIVNQGDLEVSKNTGNMRIEISDGSQVKDHILSSAAAGIPERQIYAEVEDSNKSSVINIHEDIGNDVSPHERYLPVDPVLEDTTQPMQDGVLGARMNDSEILGALEEPQEDVLDNESRTVHGSLGNQVRIMDRATTAEAENTKQSTPEVNATSTSVSDVSMAEIQSRPAVAAAAICASCNFSRNSPAIENDSNATSWISCDGCKSWFHFACAGFKNDREVRSVDKYRCRKCKPLYGSTTYVRKSSRAHSAIDYAGLHQGVIKTSDERPEHHYIKPIKDGTITFLPEKFARMRPELVTSEFFEKGTGMREPIVIPAYLNPRPDTHEMSNTAVTGQLSELSSPGPMDDSGVAEAWFSRPTEPEAVIDHGQDSLDMVIPRGLTVRQVAELYGQDEKVEVIDVKSQNGENKKWNMRRWADYYDNPNNKVVRNVISLEVSQSKLGRLIRRPQIVRDLDLQDSVWPEELLAKGEYPRVQFYCLMSVADCFTDFHIDFGGSSVFYHILKGKKTFLFIPPKEKYLKKYEEWCMSPAQNWTFLGDQTKECYRVDLSEGDTMLIPAGWIHAVWTPEDSLVIGGNFLTRLNFGMQLRVAQVEKATGVARKFRYPHFQKLHWYTVLRYLEDDPLPGTVKNLLHAGGTFVRQQPSHNEFDSWGENSRPGVENYHTRYYSQSELDGLPELTRYLLRTALIDIGSITDGISAETRNAVKKSIPRGHGEPLDVLKLFAAWCAWKRGNEPIPHWAYPDAEPETITSDKLSAAAIKKLDRDAALQAPRRQSARMQSQQAASEVLSDSPRSAAPSFAQGANDSTHVNTPKKSRLLSRVSNAISHRKTACESCRKRRRACKHKDQVALSMPSFDALGGVSADLGTALQKSASLLASGPNEGQDSIPWTVPKSRTPEPINGRSTGVLKSSSTAHSNDGSSYQPDDLASQSYLLTEQKASELPKAEVLTPATIETGRESIFDNATSVRPRHKACSECRKSKVSPLSVISWLSTTYLCIASLYS